MTILYGLLAFVAGLLIIVAIIGMTLPRIAVMDKKTIIARPVQDVYPEIVNLRNFVTWSPWSEYDPDMTMDWWGENGTVGSYYTWKGNKKVGTGKMEILEIQEPSLVVMDLNFGPRGNARASFILQETDGKTEVTWRFESDMGNALRRGALTRMMKNFVGKDFERGLENLKKKLER